MDTVLVIAVAGAAGGLIKSLVEQQGAVVLPSVEVSKDGNKYVHLGFVANLIVGSVMALTTATTPVSAILSGVASAFIAEKILERAKDLPVPNVGK